jgi:hypothetical protein
LPQDLNGFLPATVKFEGDEVVLLGSGTPLICRQDKEPEEFWEYLKSWGGAWLWEKIYLPFGLDAVVDAIAGGTAILVTDGSYSRKIRSEIDGAGWLIYCRSRKKVIFKGTTFEISTKAGSYRGELLGLLAVHLLVSAVEIFFDLPPGLRGLVACDNLGGLNRSKQRKKKIPPSGKHADILRSLRRVHAQLRGQLRYQHVYGHQDRKKTWEQMTLLEKLNYKCDSLAKSAVHQGILECPSKVSVARQLLPLESVAVFHDGQKISGEGGKELRFQIGKKEARQFYLSQLGWYAPTFDNVDWHARDKALGDKPDM